MLCPIPQDTADSSIMYKLNTQTAHYWIADIRYLFIDSTTFWAYLFFLVSQRVVFRGASAIKIYDYWQRTSNNHFDPISIIEQLILWKFCVCNIFHRLTSALGNYSRTNKSLYRFSCKRKILSIIYLLSVHNQST